jgi:hypothetical protein
MALFGSARDMSLFRTVNKELINRVIDTEVLLYKLNLNTTDTNMYGEADKKSYFQPVRMNCIIARDNRTNIGDDYGIDKQRTATFAFFKPELVDKNIVIEIGDILQYDSEYFEIDNETNVQDYIAGKDPATDIGYTLGERGSFGMDISVVIEAHVTRMNALNIVPVRSGINLNRSTKPRNL